MYSQIYEEYGMDFLPFVMEATGGFSHECSKVLNFIGRRHSEINQVSIRSATIKLKKHIAFTWFSWLGNT